VTSFWHWFVILGTLGSLAVVLTILLGNRKAPGDRTTGHSYDGIEEYDNPLPMWWVGLFVSSILFGLCYLAWYPGLGQFPGVSEWTSARQHDADQAAHDARFAPLYVRLGALDEADLHADRQAQQVGRRMFINHCATCHGTTAEGAFGFPNLTDDEWIWGAGMEPVKTALREGRQGAMPAWGPALGERGITQMANYVRRLAGVSHNASAADAAAPQFQMFCAACHGAKGTGNPALGAPDLTNDIWLYGGSIDEIAQTLRHGRNGHMPSHQALLDSDKIHIVAAYVTSLGRSRK
jgi:cytochrome c oxidase cbb3-type subunit 3